jgi:hypothetical protein
MATSLERIAADFSEQFLIGFLTLNMSPRLFKIIIISGLVGNWLFAIGRNSLSKLAARTFAIVE